MTDNIRGADRVMNQKAVYWPKEGEDDAGNPEFGEAVEINCRWEDIGELFIDENGTEQVSQSIVMVDRDVVLGGILWLGELEDLESQTEPHENEGYSRIRKFEKIPDRRATKFVRTAIL